LGVHWGAGWEVNYDFLKYALRPKRFMEPHGIPLTAFSNGALPNYQVSQKDNVRAGLFCRAMPAIAHPHSGISERFKKALDTGCSSPTRKKKKKKEKQKKKTSPLGLARLESGRRMHLHSPRATHSSARVRALPRTLAVNGASRS